ncbi:hypothetical protein [Paraliomyxa miuraensis]|uniref:hypothetical protein n=1 Tax=Paraliomyxa miuraensis TaxID=376150 RepID=UPI00224E56ED|nr:hypothetical protein [Paraliomyxa miuraensis]
MIVLSALAEGQFGLSKAKADALVEAAEVCLHHNEHRNGVRLQISGRSSASHTLEFSSPSKAALRANADLREAVEDGATAVAIAVVTRTTDYRVVERSFRTTGIDWWLGRQDGVFEARLEVSGILKGPHRVGSRVQEKLEQMQQSDATGRPGYAAVVEFSAPEARIAEKA